MNARTRRPAGPARRALTVVAGATIALSGAVGLTSAAQAASATFTTPLSGDEEVPASDSAARGVAHFALSKDGTELTYRLVVANIEDVSMAHLHLAPAGSNGSPVVWLYPDAPPPQPIPGRTQGVLATGTITSADLVGPLAGATLDDLVAAMAAGNTYVNVHTAAKPGGEVRGQID